MPDDKTYLGDGAYADYDGLGFTLYAERMPHSGPDWVYLEPQVLDAFLRYAGSKWGGKFTFTKDEDVEACRVINPPKEG